MKLGHTWAALNSSANLAESLAALLAFSSEFLISERDSSNSERKACKSPSKVRLKALRLLLAAFNSLTRSELSCNSVSTALRAFSCCSIEERVSSKSTKS